MSNFYGDGANYYQRLFDSERLAGRAQQVILHHEINQHDEQVITASDHFFLATVNQDGQPQCSYKGGEPGFVKILDEKTIVFPSYDGNGMFLSVGNILETSRVGLLFIDFETPLRLRVNGKAAVHQSHDMLVDYHEAQLIVEVKINDIFVNCPRYVHHYKRISQSPFVPKKGCETPIPEWKYSDKVRDALPEKDKQHLSKSYKPEGN